MRVVQSSSKDLNGIIEGDAESIEDDSEAAAAAARTTRIRVL